MDGFKKKFWKTFSKETVKKTEIIGVAGSETGAGSTHFSILAANYLTGILRKKTAVLEWNDTGDFSRLERAVTKENDLKKNERSFKAFEAVYFKEAGEQTLISCIEQEFEAVIIDFGKCSGASEAEFFRCSRRFLMVSLTEWNARSFMELAVKEAYRTGKIQYFIVFGSFEIQKEIEKQFRISLKRVPYLPDAFSIAGEAAEFFGEFLWY